MDSLDLMNRYMPMQMPLPANPVQERMFREQVAEIASMVNERATDSREKEAFLTSLDLVLIWGLKALAIEQAPMGMPMPPMPV